MSLVKVASFLLAVVVGPSWGDEPRCYSRLAPIVIPKYAIGLNKYRDYSLSEMYMGNGKTYGAGCGDNLPLSVTSEMPLIKFPRSSCSRAHVSVLVFDVDGAFPPQLLNQVSGTVNGMTSMLGVTDSQDSSPQPNNTYVMFLRVNVDKNALKKGEYGDSAVTVYPYQGPENAYAGNVTEHRIVTFVYCQSRNLTEEDLAAYKEGECARGSFSPKMFASNANNGFPTAYNYYVVDREPSSGPLNLDCGLGDANVDAVTMNSDTSLL